MRFLLRVAFWLGVVLVLLPSNGAQAPKQGTQVGAVEAVSAATAAVSDLGQFCTRQPDACAVGGQAATVLGQRAQAGAKMLYEFLNERLVPHENGPATTGTATVTTGTGTGTTAKPPVAAAPSSQNTLRPVDVAPTWRGPLPRPEAGPKQST